MITDEKLGIKVAENKEEGAWTRVKDQAERSIEDSKIGIEINEAILKLAKTKLKDTKKVPAGVG